MWLCRLICEFGHFISIFEISCSSLKAVRSTQALARTLVLLDAIQPVLNVIQQRPYNDNDWRHSRIRCFYFLLLILLVNAMANLNTCQVWWVQSLDRQCVKNLLRSWDLHLNLINCHDFVVHELISTTEFMLALNFFRIPSFFHPKEPVDISSLPSEARPDGIETLLTSLTDETTSWIQISQPFVSLGIQEFQTFSNII